MTSTSLRLLIYIAVLATVVAGCASQDGGTGTGTGGRETGRGADAL